MEHVTSQDEYINADLKVHFKGKLHNNSLRTSRKRGSIWGLGKGVISGKAASQPSGVTAITQFLQT